MYMAHSPITGTAKTQQEAEWRFKCVKKYKSPYMLGKIRSISRDFHNGKITENQAIIALITISHMNADRAIEMVIGHKNKQGVSV